MYVYALYDGCLLDPCSLCLYVKTQDTQTIKEVIQLCSETICRSYPRVAREMESVYRGYKEAPMLCTQMFMSLQTGHTASQYYVTADVLCANTTRSYIGKAGTHPPR